MRLIAGLAFADTVHDRLFICFAMTVTAVLVPLLLLLGLKTAVIDHLLAQLRADPVNREIIHQGNKHFDDAWFDKIAARPDVAFVVPRTREISSQIDVGHAENPTLGFEAEMVVSAPGDPVLGALSDRLGSADVIVTDRLARRGHFQLGDALDVWALRHAMEPRRADIVLRIAAILPETNYHRGAIFVPLSVATDLEDFSDGWAVPSRHWPGNPPQSARAYASFRLYARDIAQVDGLQNDLLRQDLNVASNSTVIDWTLTLDRQLTQLFAIIAACAGAGVVVALGASLWANVARKRRELSLLRMMGVSQWSMPIFPMVQAALVALLGGGLAAGVALLVAAFLNAYYGGAYLQGAPICLIPPEQLMTVIGCAMAVALVSGAAAAVPALRIEPAEGMRDP
jgi:putative ABC transport system permease protein